MGKGISIFQVEAMPATIKELTAPGYAGVACRKNVLLRKKL
jgi:hypothetical protein